jgi:hypothetical protein
MLTQRAVDDADLYERLPRLLKERAHDSRFFKSTFPMIRLTVRSV